LKFATGQSVTGVNKSATTYAANHINSVNILLHFVVR